METFAFLLSCGNFTGGFFTYIKNYLNVNILGKKLVKLMNGDIANDENK